MNYSKIYEDLIGRARQRTLTEYTERHHIIPRCLGGTDDFNNIVCLTPEEHYVAHQLLVKIYPGKKGLIYAVKMMSGQGNNKMYGWIKRQISLTGFTKEHRDNISKALRRRIELYPKVKKEKIKKKSYKDLTLEELREVWKLKDIKKQQRKDSIIITALIYAVSVQYI